MHGSSMTRSSRTTRSSRSCSTRTGRPSRFRHESSASVRPFRRRPSSALELLQGKPQATTNTGPSTSERSSRCALPGCGVRERWGRCSPSSRSSGAIRARSCRGPSSNSSSAPALSSVSSWPFESGARKSARSTRLFEPSSRGSGSNAAPSPPHRARGRYRWQARIDHARPLQPRPELADDSGVGPDSDRRMTTRSYAASFERSSTRPGSPSAPPRFDVTVPGQPRAPRPCVARARAAAQQAARRVWCLPSSGGANGCCRPQDCAPELWKKYRGVDPEKSRRNATALRVQQGRSSRTGSRRRSESSRCSCSRLQTLMSLPGAAVGRTVPLLDARQGHQGTRRGGSVRAWAKGSATLDDIPDALLQDRQQQNKVAVNVTLLWDNPRLLPDAEKRSPGRVKRLRLPARG